MCDSSDRKSNDFRTDWDHSLPAVSLLEAGGVRPAGFGKVDDVFYKRVMKSQRNVLFESKGAEFPEEVLLLLPYPCQDKWKENFHKRSKMVPRYFYSSTSSTGFPWIMGGLCCQVSPWKMSPPPWFYWHSVPAVTCCPIPQTPVELVHVAVRSQKAPTRGLHR